MNHHCQQHDRPNTPPKSWGPPRVPKLLQLTAGCILGVAAALMLSGCEHVFPPPVPELTGQRDHLIKEQQKLRNQLQQNQVDLDYFWKKTNILEQEKRANEDYLLSSRGNIRSIFNKTRAVLDKTETLYDGFVGEEVIKRKNHEPDIQGPFLLIDLGNPAPCDMTLVAASVYCESPANVIFCTVRASPDLKDQYEVLAVGQELTIPEPGKHTLPFAGRYALRIKKGEFVAAFFSPEAQIYYDSTGTGKTIAVSMETLAPKKTFASKNSDKTANDEYFNYGRAYSFRLWGFKPEEATATAK